jgi:lipid A 3-O-deacylase
MGGLFVRWRVRVEVACVAATLLASPALAFNPVNAWTRAGAPLAANAYVAPALESQNAAGAADAAYANTGAYNPAGIFDEVRAGATTFWQGGDNGDEGGVYVTGQVLFDPFIAPLDNRYLDILLRPRPHLGGSLSTDEGSSQLFGGLTWTVPLPSIAFLEASFGGTIHDAALEDAPIAVGCRVLFRESVGLGLELGPHWRVIGGIDHSSHSNLCGNENDGLTHIGGSIGYRF